MADPVFNYTRQLPGAALGYSPTTVLAQRATGLSDEIEQALADGSPQGWGALAVAGAAMAWQAIPAETRDELRGLALDAVADALSAVDWGQLGATIGATVGEAIPIIGPLIGPVIDFGESAVGAAKAIADSMVEEGRRGLASKRIEIVRSLTPAKYVAAEVRALTYPAYDGGGDPGRWRIKPCLPAALNTAEIWLGHATPESKGSCGRGVKARCHAFRDPSRFPDDCWQTGDGKICEQWSTLSVLFFPWTCTALPALPFQVPGTVAGDYEHVQDPNLEIAATQVAAIGTPAINLQIHQSNLDAVVNRIKTYWWSRWNDGEVHALWEVNEEGSIIVGGGRRTIDRSFQEIGVYVPGEQNAFYYDDSGLIRVYEGRTEDPARWGVYALNGAASGKDGGPLAMTAAQYNAAVGARLAVLRARAEMLRNRGMMEATLSEMGPARLDPKVRGAVIWSASGSGLLPQVPPSSSTSSEGVDTWKARPPKRASVGKKKGGGGGAGLALALAAGFFVLKK